jgi:hypothetical protein
VNELAQALELVGLQHVANVVLDRFDIVLGDRFERSDLCNIFGPKVLDNRSQGLYCRGGEWGGPGDSLSAQRNQPLDFDGYARSIQCCL